MSAAITLMLAARSTVTRGACLRVPHADRQPIAPGNQGHPVELEDDLLRLTPRRHRAGRLLIGTDREQQLIELRTHLDADLTALEGGDTVDLDDQGEAVAHPHRVDGLAGLRQHAQTTEEASLVARFTFEVEDADRRLVGFGSGREITRDRVHGGAVERDMPLLQVECSASTALRWPPCCG